MKYVMTERRFAILRCVANEQVVRQWVVGRTGYKDVFHGLRDREGVTAVMKWLEYRGLVELLPRKQGSECDVWAPKPWGLTEAGRKLLKVRP